VDESKMRVTAAALIVVSDRPPTVTRHPMERSTMKKRFAVIVAALGAAAALLGGGAIAAGHGLIWDDGKAVQPGSLDDGRDLLPQTKISLAQANAAAQRAASGALGQVDLEQSGGRVVYVVDVGSREVSVDASDGSIASITPRD